MHLPPRDPGFPHSAILHAIVECITLCLTVSKFLSHSAQQLLAGPRKMQSPYPMEADGTLLQSIMLVKPVNTSTKQWRAGRIFFQ
jgi:hypothetical protein